MVDRGALISHVGGLAQNEETVREPGRDPDLPTVPRLERHANPLAVAWRRSPNVDGDVEDSTGHRTHELALRLLELKMESAKNVSRRATVVVLRESCREAERLEAVLAKDLGEEAPRVAMHGSAHDQNLRKRGRFRDHATESSSASPRRY